MEKLVLIKVGGKIVEEEETLRQLLNDFAAIEGYKVLVHGGGRSATKLAAQLGIESKMVNGRRITDAETLKVVTMVYGGLVNKNIVAGTVFSDTHFNYDEGFWGDFNVILPEDKLNEAISRITSKIEETNY